MFIAIMYVVIIRNRMPSNMANAVNLYLKFTILWIIIPLVSLYQYDIYVSEKLPITKCQQINNTTYQCSSITELFQQLSNCCNSTDITIEPGNYNLALSYELADLHDIRIRSETNAVIQCAANVNGTYDFDTGIAFVRVSNLVITNISIVGCGMKHNSTNHIKERFIEIRSAVYIQNSTNITLDNVTIRNSNGIGLLIFNTNGSVSITRSSFVNNILNSSEQAKYLTGGGGVRVELTDCSLGITQCDSTKNYFKKLANYVIDHCVFIDNAAIYHLNGSQTENLPKGIFITVDAGGGLFLYFNGDIQNNSFRVSFSSFTSNRAHDGAGLAAFGTDNTSCNTVQIYSCQFVENVAEFAGGGITLGNAIFKAGVQNLFNTYIVANCSFEKNQAVVGGGISGFGNLEFQRKHPTNHFEVSDSSFINNSAQYGSAIEANNQYFDFITTGVTLTFILNNCTFTANNLHENNSLSNSSSIGAVATFEVDIEFRGATIFSNNNSTALIADRAVVKFSNDSVTTFQDNSGLYGGAISLIGGAWIGVYPNSSVIFLRNTAVQYGGAIYVELSTPFDYLLSHVCFIRYYLENVSPDEWNTNFTFINNTTPESNIGKMIFASTLNPCVKAYNVGNKFLYDGPFYHYSHKNNSIVSTAPSIFKFLNKTNGTFAVIPGEVYDLPVELIDELGQVVSSAMFIATCTGPPSPHIVSTYHFTNGSIKIAGKPNEICELEMKTDADYQVFAKAKIKLLNCPPGFVYSNEKEECECIVDHDHQNPAISDCELTSYQAYFNQFYWIGYESDDAEDLLISPCPYGYCYEDYVSKDQLLPRDANKITLDKFVCGNRSSTGFLCGQCIEGYSVALNSPTLACHRCKDPHLGILYLLISYIIPVSILFYIIMAYNIRMTTGPIGAFLFFSQILSSQYRFAFDYSVKANYEGAQTGSSILIAIYSITNLQFFYHNSFCYCLFSNAGSVDILAFNLLLSFYPVLLVFVYFLLRRYCTCRVKCFQRFRFSNKSVTHGVCAFLVLCFAKINLLAFGILKPGNITYINGTSFRKVVYLQGNLKYFGDLLYNVYAVGSLFTIVMVISIPTIILIFHPIMIDVARYFGWGETKIVLFINKVLLIHNLKPVLDSFQGDYKDNLSFFAGLHSFLYRIIFFSIVGAASSPNIDNLILLVVSFFIIILLIHILVMPFKSHIDNVSYTLIYFLMLTIVIIELYVYATGRSSSGLAWLEIILSLLPLVCSVFYCLWKVCSMVCVWRRHCCLNDKHELVSTLTR